MGFKLPKTALLRKSKQYSVVYRQGKRYRGDHFSLIFIENDQGFNRLGISVHGVKKAVERNRMKRLIREFFRMNRDFLPPSKDIVFAVRKECLFKNPHQIFTAVIQAVNASSPRANRRRE